LLPGGANQFPGGSPPLWTSAFHGARKYLNNVIEQDHRSVKKRVWLAKGYGSFQSAWRTLQGIETVNMIRKGRVRWLAKGDAVGQARFIGELFGLAAV
jgi:transposase, IS6 family